MSKSAKNAEYCVFDFKKHRIFNMNQQSPHLREPTLAYLNGISKESHLTFTKKVPFKIKNTLRAFSKAFSDHKMIQNSLLWQVKISQDMDSFMIHNGFGISGLPGIIHIFCFWRKIDRLHLNRSHVTVLWICI